MFDPLSKHRREFLAKALMDCVKLAVGTAIVSGFFGNLATTARIALGIAIIALFVTAWFLFPPKGVQ